ncbi:hypothetical protein ACP70R_035329 [Stipagrostis hirtigluma subsp. patula]
MDPIGEHAQLTSPVSPITGSTNDSNSSIPLTCVEEADCPQSSGEFVVHGDLAAELNQYCDSFIYLSLYDGMVIRVFLYSADGNITLANGWPMVREYLGLLCGDVAIFASLGLARFSARFYDRNGFERTVHHSRSSIFSPPEAGCGFAKPRLYVLAPCMTLTPSEMWAVVLIGSRFVRDIPIYICIMNYSSIKKGILYFSKEFTTAYLGSHVTRGIDLTISVCGDEESAVGRLAIGGDNVARVTSGWASLVGRCNVHEGDLCAIRLTLNPARAFITVHVLSSYGKMYTTHTCT